MVAWCLALDSIPWVGRLWALFVCFNPTAYSAVISGAGHSPFAPIHGEGDSVDVWRSAFVSIPQSVQFLGVGAVGIHSHPTASLAVLRRYVRFSLAPIPRRGKFRVRVTFGLCFNPTDKIPTVRPQRRRLPRLIVIIKIIILFCTF